MGKLYRLIIISIIALIFAIGCSDTSSQSSGGGNITDNGSSGGNGGDGSGGDGSGSSSEIINSTMRASASIDNALLYTFFTPAAATNGASLKYSWDFDDNAVETTDTNIINHEFSKYGKSYNVTLEVSNIEKCDLIITTGGTGPAIRDVTPEATEAVCQKMLPGFGELMRQTSLQYVPTTILSRQTAGIRNQTLIINLPGKPKSIRECLDAVFPAVPYCLDLIGAAYLETNENIIKAFRPKSS